MRRIVSGIMFALLLIGMLTPVFNIRPVRAETEGFTPEVTVFPEHPSTEDSVNVTVSFTFYTLPPYVEEFGPLTQVGNAFSIKNVTIYVPAPWEIVCALVHTSENNYSLGKLSEGVYQVQAYVYQVHYNLAYYLAASVSFNVTLPSKPVGGYSLATEGYPTIQPLTFYLTLIVILTASFTAIKRKTSRKTK